MRASVVDMSTAPHRLDLSSQGLNDLSEETGEEIHRSGIKDLDLSLNRLASLPPSISRHFSNLLKLDISSNAFSELPLELCSLHGLQALTAKHNQMKSLPRDFHKLAGLRSLNLAGNCFEHFPQELCDLGDLQELHLGSNRISWITPSIKRLKR